MKITKKSTPEQAGEKMLACAHQYVQKMSGFSNKADSMQVYYKDASDFCNIAKHIFGGDFKAAVRAAYDMDTCPRDEIPQDVWDFITHHSRV